MRLVNDLSARCAAGARRFAMTEYAIRLLVGGVAVSAFATLGDIFRPKTAPSIALVTLVMALLEQGPGYVIVEGRSMVVGSLALCIYCLIVCHLTKRGLSATTAALLASIAWFVFAFGLKWIIWGAP